MIHHLMSWPLRADVDRVASIERVRTLLMDLEGKVDSIRTIAVVENIAYPEANNDLAVLATFDDVPGLEAFVTHPLHQAAVAEIHTLVTGRAGIDWQTAD
ncbi:Dabb family protein [Microbacterium hominis]|uniref:Dabb family protein n=1 Tax=Microbacterium hominis TaxID=162426 RepID=UPI000768603E|nr:Dabb family protein [Microbacterium hominis]KXC05059.1 hypothetical protein MhomT_13070 [Microbacterium hominis]